MHNGIHKDDGIYFKNSVRTLEKINQSTYLIISYVIPLGE